MLVPVRKQKNLAHSVICEQWITYYCRLSMHEQMRCGWALKLRTKKHGITSRDHSTHTRRTPHRICRRCTQCITVVAFMFAESIFYVMQSWCLLTHTPFSYSPFASACQPNINPSRAGALQIPSSEICNFLVLLLYVTNLHFLGIEADILWLLWCCGWWHETRSDIERCAFAAVENLWDI